MTRTTGAANARLRQRALGMVTCCMLAASPVLALSQVGGQLMISVREVDAGLRSTVTIDGGSALAARGATVVSTSQARDSNRDADVIQRIEVGNGRTGWISAASSGYLPEVVGTGRGRAGTTVAAGTGAADGGSDSARGGDRLRIEASAVDDRSGFIVVPHRLNSDRVSVDVTRVRDRSTAWGGGEADRLSTRIEGRLGEWLPLAGLDAGLHGGVGAARGSSADGAARRRFEIRVDEILPP